MPLTHDSYLCFAAQTSSVPYRYGVPPSQVSNLLTHDWFPFIPSLILTLPPHSVGLF